MKAKPPGRRPPRRCAPAAHSRHIIQTMKTARACDDSPYIHKRGDRAMGITRHMLVTLWTTVRVTLIIWYPVITSSHYLRLLKYSNLTYTTPESYIPQGLLHWHGRADIHSPLFSCGRFAEISLIVAAVNLNRLFDSADKRLIEGYCNPAGYPGRLHM